MFLLTVTSSEIDNTLQSHNVEQIKIGSSIATIITDNFLSKLIPLK